MNDFERGFIEELAKIAASLSKPEETKEMPSVAPQKPLATAMRSPLSLSTNIKPKDQTFYKGI